MRTTRGVRAVTRIVFGVSWAVAAALLVKGHAEAGDGFSAGLTAATGTVAYILVFGLDDASSLGLIRHAQRIAGAGLVLVLTPALGPLLLGQPPFTHYPPPGSEPPSAGLLELTSAFVLELGIFAVVLGLVLRGVELLGSPELPHGELE